MRFPWDISFSSRNIFPPGDRKLKTSAIYSFATHSRNSWANNSNQCLDLKWQIAAVDWRLRESAGRTVASEASWYALNLWIFRVARKWKCRESEACVKVRRKSDKIELAKRAENVWNFLIIQQWTQCKILLNPKFSGPTKLIEEA